MGRKKISELTLTTTPQITDDYVLRRSTSNFRFRPAFAVNAAAFGASPSASAATNVTAIQAAIDAAAGGSSNNREVILPHQGTYQINADLDPKSGIRIRGCGRGVTTIKCVGNPSGDRVFIKTTEDRSFLIIEDLTLEGNWDNDKQDVGSNGLITLAQYTDVQIRNVGLKYARHFGININRCTSVHVSHVRAEYCVRDMIGVWNTPQVTIANNDLNGNDDDCISVNLDGTVTIPVRSSVVISGNVFRDTGGIKVMGPKNVIIANNVGTRLKGSAVQVGVSPTSGVDRTSSLNIKVVENVFTDVIDRNYFVDGTASNINSRVYIRADGEIPIAGGLTVAPGEINTSTGQIQSPYEYNYATSGASNTAPLRGQSGVDISRNILKRTLPTATNYSDWGYGSDGAFTATGFRNTAVSDTMLRGMGIEPRVASIDGLSICDNYVNVGQRALYFTLDQEVDRMIKNGIVARNYFGEATEACITWPGTTLTYQDIAFEDNILDGDPYVTNVNRGSGGTWLASAEPVALSVDQFGAAFRRNKVRNCARTLDNTGASAAQIYEGNIVYGDFAATGFSTSNRGVGNIPGIGDGAQWWVQYENSNPTSASYKQLLGANLRNNSAMPSSGTWLIGMFVGVRANNTALLGWRRLTTGSTHVLGTDWIEIYGTALVAQTLEEDVLIDATSANVDIALASSTTYMFRVHVESEGSDGERCSIRALVRAYRSGGSAPVVDTPTIEAAEGAWLIINTSASGNNLRVNVTNDMGVDCHLTTRLWEIDRVATVEDS